MTTRRAAVGLAFTMALTRPAFAWPDRSLRVIVPYPAGGATDTFARLVTQAVQARLGQSIVVENRGGASGAIGATAAARAPADGYTLMVTITDTQAINPAVFRTLQYDPEADFAPVSLLTRVPFGLLAGPTTRRFAAVGALIDFAKANPGRITFATWGVGSTSHLATERVAKWAGIELTHVPFTGGAPARQAVAAGQVDFMSISVGEGAPLTRDGTCRYLAMMAPARIAGFEGVPTLSELGFDMTTGFWVAMYAPARTPAPLIAQLNEAVRGALASPELAAAFASQFAVPEASTPEELGALQRAERAVWGAAARDANVRLD